MITNQQSIRKEYKNVFPEERPIIGEPESPSKFKTISASEISHNNYC